MTIIITKSEEGYYVTVNGETVLECLSEEEIDALTIGAIHACARDHGIIE